MGDDNVEGDKLSRIPSPQAMPSAREIVQLAGELQLDRDAEEESYSVSEEEGEEYFLDDLSRREKSSYSRSKW